VVDFTARVLSRSDHTGRGLRSSATSVGADTIRRQA